MEICYQVHASAYLSLTKEPRYPVNTGLVVPQKLYVSCAAQKCLLPGHECNPESAILHAIT